MIEIKRMDEEASKVYPLVKMGIVNRFFKTNYPYPSLNPFQSFVMNESHMCNKGNNVIAIAKTGAGKSVISELITAYYLNRNEDHIIIQKIVSDKNLFKEIRKKKIKKEFIRDRDTKLCSFLKKYELLDVELKSGEKISNLIEKLNYKQKHDKENPWDGVKKVIYLAPMKSLLNEKYQEFKNMFPNKKVMSIFGNETNLRETPVDDVDIILMTNEKFNSATIKHKRRDYKFLKNVGCIVMDESHSIGFEGRGATIETSLMRFSYINPNCQYVFLSATISNKESQARFLSSLSNNNRRSVVIDSEYTPVKVEHREIKWFPETNEPTIKDYWNLNSFGYDIEEIVKEQFQKDPKSQFLIFCHRKKDTEELMERFNKPNYKKYGISAAFHNGSLNSEERKTVEKGFKDGIINVLSATTTLSVGVNLPANNVLIMPFAGGNLIDKETYLQMVGRCGRVGVAAYGIVHILYPITKEKQYKIFKESSVKTESQLFPHKKDEFGGNLLDLDYDELEFHLICNVFSKVIQNMKDLDNWYRKSFHYHALIKKIKHENKELGDYELENKINLYVNKYIKILQNVFFDLQKKGFIKIIDSRTKTTLEERPKNIWENSEKIQIKLEKIGFVPPSMYVLPIDVFKYIMKNKKIDKDLSKESLDLMINNIVPNSFLNMYLQKGIIHKEDLHRYLIENVDKLRKYEVLKNMSNEDYQMIKNLDRTNYLKKYQLKTLNKYSSLLNLNYLIWSMKNTRKEQTKSLKFELKTDYERWFSTLNLISKFKPMDYKIADVIRSSKNEIKNIR